MSVYFPKWHDTYTNTTNSGLLHRFQKGVSPVRTRARGCTTLAYTATSNDPRHLWTPLPTATAHGTDLWAEPDQDRPPGWPTPPVPGRTERTVQRQTWFVRPCPETHRSWATSRNSLGVSEGPTKGVLVKDLTPTHSVPTSFAKVDTTTLGPPEPHLRAESGRSEKEGVAALLSSARDLPGPKTRAGTRKTGPPVPEGTLKERKDQCAFPGSVASPEDG